MPAAPDAAAAGALHVAAPSSAAELASAVELRGGATPLNDTGAVQLTGEAGPDESGGALFRRRVHPLAAAADPALARPSVPLKDFGFACRVSFASAGARDGSA